MVCEYVNCHQLAPSCNGAFLHATVRPHVMIWYATGYSYRRGILFDFFRTRVSCVTLGSCRQ